MTANSVTTCCNNMLNEAWPQVLFVLSMLKNDCRASVSKHLQICNTTTHRDFFLFFFTLLCWSNHLRKTSKCVFLIIKKATHSILSFKGQTGVIWCLRIYPKTYIHPCSVCFKYLVYKSVHFLSVHCDKVQLLLKSRIKIMDWIDSI